MRIEEDLKLGFKDVLFRPKRSTLKSRSQVSLTRQFTFKHTQTQWQGVPVIAANMDTVGTFAMARTLAGFEMMTAVHKHYSLAQWQTFVNDTDPALLGHVMVSTGTSEEDFIKTRQILAMSEALRFICVDVANGYSQHFVEFLRKIREACPNHVILAGNVVTGEMVEELILSGADIVKVGIGPGSVCTTRVKTGVGYPQLSAIIECADAAHGLGGQIVGDGGCTCPGDVAKTPPNGSKAQSAFDTARSLNQLRAQFRTAGSFTGRGTVPNRVGAALREAMTETPHHEAPRRRVAGQGQDDQQISRLRL